MALFMPKPESRRHIKFLVALSDDERDFLDKQANDEGVDKVTLIRQAIRDKYFKRR